MKNIFIVPLLLGLGYVILMPNALAIPPTGSSTENSLEQTIDRAETVLGTSSQIFDRVSNIVDGKSSKTVTTSNHPKDLQAPIVSNGGILPGPEKATDGISYGLNRLLPGITNWVLAVILSCSVVGCIIGGIMFVLSLDVPEQKVKARLTITFSILGMLVGVLSYGAVKILININFLT